MQAYTELLKQVEQQASKYGEAMQPPATSAMLDKLKDDAKKELGADVPNDYLTFLSIMNGIDWNGMSIYSCADTISADSVRSHMPGFIETNLIHRDVVEKGQIIVLGEDSLDIYVYDPKTEEYQSRDRTSLDIMESFETFNDLMMWAVNKHLM